MNKSNLLLEVFDYDYETEEIISEEYLAELLSRYRRPLIVCASRAVNRYISEHDEEWSVAVLAFYEAVRDYSCDKGSFLSFMRLVVKRRLTDHLRSMYRQPDAELVPQDVFTGDSDSEEFSGVRSALSGSALSSGSWPGQYTVADEIEAVQQELSSFGFSFFDIAGSSPKAGKTKEKCAQAAAALISDDSLFFRMQQTRTLPVSDL